VAIVAVVVLVGARNATAVAVIGASGGTMCGIDGFIGIARRGWRVGWRATEIPSGSAIARLGIGLVTIAIRLRQPHAIGIVVLLSRRRLRGFRAESITRSVTWVSVTWILVERRFQVGLEIRSPDMPAPVARRRFALVTVRGLRGSRGLRGTWHLRCNTRRLRRPSGRRGTMRGTADIIGERIGLTDQTDQFSQRIVDRRIGLLVATPVRIIGAI